MSKLVQLKDTNGNVYPKTLVGKTLWSGTFTSGTLKVPGLSRYNVIVVNVGGCSCFGNKHYGAGGVGAYGDNRIIHYGYRFSYADDTISTNEYDRGGYAEDGSRQSIYNIIGIF